MAEAPAAEDEGTAEEKARREAYKADRNLAELVSDTLDRVKRILRWERMMRYF